MKKIKLVIKNTFPLLNKLYLKFVNRKRGVFYKLKNDFTNKNGLEIGGPSFVFSNQGPIPIYSIANNIDNVNYDLNTLWSKNDPLTGYNYAPNKKGKQFLADGTDINQIVDESYDFVLSSHVIEHIANPIKAILEWKRILKKNGTFVLIAPDHNRTYDRKRKITTISHIMQDYFQSTTENDITHIEEIEKLHDITYDSNIASKDDLKKYLNQNNIFRYAHHHVFDLNLLNKIFELCDFKIIHKSSFRPYHLLIIAKK